MESIADCTDVTLDPATAEKARFIRTNQIVCQLGFESFSRLKTSRVELFFEAN